MSTCKGCKDYNNCGLASLKSQKFIEECPCRNCLVKGVCHNPCTNLIYHFAFDTIYDKPTKTIKVDKNG